MSKISMNGIIAGLEKSLAVVNELTPAAKALGIVPQVATIGISAMSIIAHTLGRGKELKEALTTHDEAKLRIMLEELQRANDKLHDAIEAS